MTKYIPYDEDIVLLHVKDYRYMAEILLIRIQSINQIKDKVSYIFKFESRWFGVCIHESIFLNGRHIYNKDNTKKMINILDSNQNNLKFGSK